MKAEQLQGWIYERMKGEQLQKWMNESMTERMKAWINDLTWVM